MATQAERRALTRQKILDAAQQLFKNKGFERTSVMQIAERANIVKGTFYQHFETKMDVLVALSRRDGRERVLALVDKVHDGLSPLEALRRYYLVLAQWFEEHAPVAQDVIISAIRMHDSQATSPQENAHAFTLCMLEIAQQRNEIRRDITPLQLAFVLGGAFTLAVINWSCDPQKTLLQSHAQQCLKVFLEGAQPFET